MLISFSDQLYYQPFPYSQIYTILYINMLHLDNNTILLLSFLFLGGRGVDISLQTRGGRIDLFYISDTVMLPH